MPIRLNIPAWGLAELVAGTRALLPLPVRPLYVERLRAALEHAVPGRRPLPVRSARFGIALAVRALGLARRRIAVPGYVCPAVLTGLRTAPAEAVPIDCLPGSTRFDPAALADAAAAGRIDAVLAPNTYGADQDFEALGALAALGLPVIEDAAYQAGREDAAGQACGGRGAAGVWSFNFKALTAAGGGVLWLPADQLARAEQELTPARSATESRALFLDYALRGVLRHRIPGFLPGFAPPHPAGTAAAEPRAALQAGREGIMSELQAALAYAQWRQRDGLAAAQRARARQLAGALARCAALTLLPGLAPDGAIHLLPVLVRTAPDAAPAAVLRARRILHAAGVQTEEAYPILFDAPLPNARALAARLFLVPAGPALGARQLARIASALEEAGKAIARDFGTPEPDTGAAAPQRDRRESSPERSDAGSPADGETAAPAAAAEAAESSQAEPQPSATAEADTPPPQEAAPQPEEAERTEGAL